MTESDEERQIPDFNYLQNFWWVVGRSVDLKTRTPLKIRLLGHDYVLFRASHGKAACFEDRCPHRQIPLSLGQVVNCQLRCPYHGWAFDESGNCTNVPGRIGDPFSTPLLKPYQTHEAHGLIWVCTADQGRNDLPFVTPHLPSNEMKTKIHSFKIATNMIDILENFMDPFHTAILHNDLIRKDTIRSINKVMPRHSEDGFEVRYTKEAAQSTWFRRFQRDIEMDLGRFRMPGIIELEFHSKDQLEFANTFYVTPIDQDHVRMVTIVSIKERIIPAWLLFLVARPILMKALHQDIWMLQLQNKARHTYHNRRQIILDTDIVRRQLELALSGRSEKVNFTDLEALL